MSNFDDLNNMILQFPIILELLQSIKQKQANGTIEKRWLSTQEVATYTSYSVETIKAKVKRGELVREYHYYQEKRKLLFEKTKIDEWIMGASPINNSNYDVDTLINDLIA